MGTRFEISVEVDGKKGCPPRLREKEEVNRYGMPNNDDNNSITILLILWNRRREVLKLLKCKC